MKVSELASSAAKMFRRPVLFTEKFPVAVPANVLAENIIRVNNTVYLVGMAPETDAVELRRYSVLKGDQKPAEPGAIFVGSVAGPESSTFNLFRHVAVVE
ncbi:MAG: hypothetical protein MRY21_06565 [Simkaniaceae bacterium]|nr:hypothetical protein [Simkaniaceae bacterium]